jgi:hypothetical protein
VYDIFDSASALELNPEILALTPGGGDSYSKTKNIHTDTVNKGYD